MKKLLLCLSVLVSLTASAQQVPKSLTAANGQFIGFYQYTPTNYTTTKKYPLIIFLHGVGEKGNGTTELSRLLGLGVPGAINGGHNMTFTWNGKTETFLVLSPQLDGKYGSWQNFYVDEMINYAKKNLSIDENRIFLTGLSLGGGGVWSYAGASLDNAKKLAAIGVCCGTCPGINFANLTNANLPVWAFHAQDDATVGAGCTTGSISKIEQLKPAVKPYMTLWPDGQHFIWGRVYSTDYSWQNPNLYEWFLGQDKSKPVNKRPVANAGNPLSILTSLGIVTLSGAGSTDPDGKIVRYIWRKISGPSYGTITATVSLDGKTTVTGLNWPGTYQYELKVVDDRADWSLDTVTVTVGSGGTTNKPPVANAGADVTITLPTSSVTLKGSGTDADGSITKYAWSKVSGGAATIASASSATTNVTGLVAGTYTFRLTVTDNSNATATDDVVVTVKPANSTPTVPKIANAGADRTITTSSTTLDGSGSVNPDGPIYAWTWKQVSGPSTATLADEKAKSTTVSNLKTGKYSFSLTIWDHNWRPQADTMVLTVNLDGSTQQPAPNKPAGKIANAGADKTITLPTSSLTLDGSGSVNPDGPIYAWTWKQISGPTTVTIANEKVQTTTASGLTKAGTYRFSLTIWDHTWRPQADTMQVVVNNGSQPTYEKIANAGADRTITLPVSSLTLDGSGSVNPNGPIYAWTWKQISGPATVTLANEKVQTTTASGLTKAGTYRFSLTIWDHTWRPQADTMQVTVNPASSSPNQTVGKIANAGPDLEISLPTNSVILDGSNSVNPDGPIYAYTWNQISGPTTPTINNAKEAIANVSGLVAGTYQFRFTIWDHTWRPQADTMVVVVKGTSSAPAKSPTSGASGNGTIANAGPDITLVLPTNTTTLNGAASADPKGVIRAWQWAKISGPGQHNIANASQSVTTLSNLVEGTYRFRLTVWGNDWTPFADTMEIRVVPATAVTGSSITTQSSGTQTAEAAAAQTAVATETETADKLLVYPNPAQAQINVQTNSAATGASFVNIYDMAGKLILKTGFQKAQSLHQQVINISKLLPGVYHLEVVIDNQKRLNSKFIKQ